MEGVEEEPPPEEEELPSDVRVLPQRARHLVRDSVQRASRAQIYFFSTKTQQYPTDDVEEEKEVEEEETPQCARH